MAYCHQDMEPFSTPPGLLGGFWGPEGDISDSPGPEGLKGEGGGQGREQLFKIKGLRAIPVSISICIHS